MYLNKAYSQNRYERALRKHNQSRMQVKQTADEIRIAILPKTPGQICSGFFCQRFEEI
jgi:hypothetical protein